MKKNLLLIAFANAMLIGLLLFVLKVPAASDGRFAIVGVCLSGIACVFWSLTKLAPGQPAARLQSNFIIALAFAELVMLLGTFMGGDPENKWKFAVAAWGLMGVFVIPKIVQL